MNVLFNLSRETAYLDLHRQRLLQHQLQFRFASAHEVRLIEGQTMNEVPTMADIAGDVWIGRNLA